MTSFVREEGKKEEEEEEEAEEDEEEEEGGGGRRGKEEVLLLGVKGVGGGCPVKVGGVKGCAAVLPPLQLPGMLLQHVLGMAGIN